MTRENWAGWPVGVGYNGSTRPVNVVEAEYKGWHLRCQEPECEKGAQGASDRCKAHGGGKRCQEPGCGKGAVGASGRCSAHGGGKHRALYASSLG